MLLYGIPSGFRACDHKDPWIGCGSRADREYYSLSESSEAIEERLERPKLGGPLTSDVVPNSLYHPMTILDRFRSSSII